MQFISFHFVRVFIIVVIYEFHTNQMSCVSLEWFEDYVQVIWSYASCCVCCFS